MKQSINILAIAFLFLLFSCNMGKKEKAQEPTPTVSLFKVIMVTHPVANFDTWKPVYMAHDSLRQAYGISHFLLGRGIEDTNSIVIINKITDVQKAKDFSTLPALKDAMTTAGVTGPPSFSYADVIRNEDSKIEIKDRVMVVHRVKDFDAWLKVFDQEGSTTRMENGLIDRALARDADDANKIYIVFAISDMEKAKIRMNSEELKKLMTDAGVEGPPQFIFYRLVD